MENLQKDRRYLFNSECMSLFLLRAQNVWIRICLKKETYEIDRKIFSIPFYTFYNSTKGNCVLKVAGKPLIASMLTGMEKAWIYRR
jgi:hypothetical protein